jgi:hypothetical protein
MGLQTTQQGQYCHPWGIHGLKYSHNVIWIHLSAIEI